jgi:hypothetical protein
MLLIAATPGVCGKTDFFQVCEKNCRGRRPCWQNGNENGCCLVSEDHGQSSHSFWSCGLNVEVHVSPHSMPLRHPLGFIDSHVGSCMVNHVLLQALSTTVFSGLMIHCTSAVSFSAQHPSQARPGLQILWFPYSFGMLSHYLFVSACLTLWRQSF